MSAQSSQQCPETSSVHVDSDGPMLYRKKFICTNVDSRAIAEALLQHRQSVSAARVVDNIIYIEVPSTDEWPAVGEILVQAAQSIVSGVTFCGNTFSLKIPHSPGA